MEANNQNEVPNMFGSLGFSSAKPAEATTTTNENKNTFGAASTSGGLFGYLIVVVVLSKIQHLHLIISLKHKAHSVPQHNQLHSVQQLVYLVHLHLHKKLVLEVQLLLEPHLLLEHHQHLVLHLHSVV
jgi:hypothetical protein